ncbi:molybdate transport system ATP-binding protein [Verrucomicrobium sp. GAS474]|uniref:molybdenum ABC transporter ATP-binding protein n=1 Tax=Verrucomicrobium sp. GAS474 TaxID=1882831 RepID=UPI00087B28CD|nr:ATP-binding cassette domain-containing protein [Verrucomicrobium sp. GAS474]SDU23731.1 molybdate transport system ATP-binding protein [Verrucomicrobium sp. GAS474]
MIDALHLEHVRIRNIETGDLVIPLGVTVLFGPSGAGKTTLLRCVAGLDRPEAGKIFFRGFFWNDDRFVCPPQERRIGYVPQNYALFPHLTVRENLVYGRFRPGHGGPPSREEREKNFSKLIGQLGLSGLEDRLPSALSGGQRQRVALGRALWPHPGLLLLDEPLSALDVPTRERLRGELRAFLVEAGIPALLVTHDPKEAAVLGDQVVLIDQGRILQHGSVSEVFNRPATAEAARIVGSDTLFEGEVEEQAEGLARVQTGNARLLAVAPQLSPSVRLVHVSIQAADVSLARDSADTRRETSSPRNRLPGTISRIGEEGALVRVEIDCGLPGGVPLKALLTREAMGDLGLRPGLPVIALIKAPCVHLMARDA